MRVVNLRRAMATAVIVASAVAVMGSGSSNTATKVDAGSSGQSSSSSSFKVGDQVKLGDFVVTVNSVKDPFTSTNSLDKPKGRYVAADVTVTNNGSKTQTVSSMVCFTFNDSTGQGYNMALVVGAPKAPDGEIAPGQSIRGTIVIDVPTTATGLQMKFKCDLFSSGSATINLG